VAGWGRGFPPKSRPRTVSGGITARSRRGAIGETWWSRRFVEVLESLQMGGRLTRGRSYARSGQVLDLEVAAGSVAARVQGSRRAPYDVWIELPVIWPEQWADIEEALTSQALFSAKLLSGEMPPEIEDVFDDLGLPLFPTWSHELHLECSCPDWAVPCKHLAATFYVLAESFDTDPFLIFAWRGRTRDDLLAGLRRHRGTAAATPCAGEPRSPALFAAEDQPLADNLDGFWSFYADLAATAQRPRAAALASDLVLRQLDQPNITVRGRNLVELLGPAYQAMATAAEPVPSAPTDRPLLV